MRFIDRLTFWCLALNGFYDKRPNLNDYFSDGLRLTRFLVGVLRSTGFLAGFFFLSVFVTLVWFLTESSPLYDWSISRRSMRSSVRSSNSFLKGDVRFCLAWIVEIRPRLFLPQLSWEWFCARVRHSASADLQSDGVYNVSYLSFHPIDHGGKTSTYWD